MFDEDSQSVKEDKAQDQEEQQSSENEEAEDDGGWNIQGVEESESQESDAPSEESDDKKQPLPESLLRVLAPIDNYAPLIDYTKSAVERENAGTSIFQKTKRGNKIDLMTTSINL